ncbi:MAG TPA: sigma-70 family RNA polymerase sigma factor [Paludibacter sp.]
MENTKENWEKQDNWFIQWLQGKQKFSLNSPDNILKSIFFFNREKIRQSVCAHYTEIIDSSQERMTIPCYGPNSLDQEDKELSEGTKVEILERIKSLDENSTIDSNNFKESSQVRINKSIIDGLNDNRSIIYHHLYMKYFRTIYWYLRQNSGSFEQAKDIFQDALVIILEKDKQDNLDITCDFGTYLFSICKNLWLAQLRKHNRENIFTSSSLGDYEYGADFVDTEEKPDDYEVIAHAISNLGENCQKLLTYFYYDNQSWETIADKLGYSTAANARNQKYKCLEKIRSVISDSKN